ncbi:MAG TPA: chemotaxis response regulator protein-glutamate methylesterase [Terriglobales bacterium]|nr:chemotaxis response regulator protein-glutamate methylesterase [Terriglobales bacterium]
MRNNVARVLVVDDSALMRKLIPQILERDTSIQVVGTAMDGTFAMEKIADLRPDVVTLDLDMPRMDGMETLRKIMRQYKLPVIVVSSLTTEGATATLKALGLGAFDFVAKPQDATNNMSAVAEELIDKIKVAARCQMISVPEPKVSSSKTRKTRRPVAPNRVVAIGISTGGPQALQYMLSHFPAEFPATILVVQHMPEGFTEMFARRLDETCALEVKEARSGDMLLAGRVLICPGDRHMKVKRMPLGNVVVLADGERVNGHRPSVDVLFHSVAREFGTDAVGLLMTGMGEDGAEGLGAIKAAGGMTIAQSEESCVVFGMPRVAIERGYAARVVPLDALANAVLAQCQMPPRSRSVMAVAEAE